MSGAPFYKKPATSQKNAYEWPPKRTATVKVSRQEPIVAPVDQERNLKSREFKSSRSPLKTSSSSRHIFFLNQQVKEGSRAENAGLKLGDSIVTINDKDTTNMTLQEANNVLEQAAQQDVKLGVIK